MMWGRCNAPLRVHARMHQPLIPPHAQMPCSLLLVAGSVSMPRRTNKRNAPKTGTNNEEQAAARDEAALTRAAEAGEREQRQRDQQKARYAKPPAPAPALNHPNLYNLPNSYLSPHLPSPAARGTSGETSFESGAERYNAERRERERHNRKLTEKTLSLPSVTREFSCILQPSSSTLMLDSRIGIIPCLTLSPLAAVVLPVARSGPPSCPISHASHMRRCGACMRSQIC